MDILSKILKFLVTLLVLIVVVGGGALYYTQGNFWEHGAGGNHQETPKEDTHQGDSGEQAGDKVTPRTPTPEEMASIHVAFLNQYISDLQRSIALINEANGLITSDPFFANPPKVDSLSPNTTPFDSLDPADITPDPTPRDTSVPGTLVMPEYYFFHAQKNMQNVHRGIYKMAQGMTIMNQTIDRMNQDINLLRKDPTYLPPTAYQPMLPFSNFFMNPMLSQAGYQQAMIPHASQVHGTAGHSGFFTAENIMLIIYIFLVLGLIFGMISVLSYFFRLLRGSIK